MSFLFACLACLAGAHALNPAATTAAQDRIAIVSGKPEPNATEALENPELDVSLDANVLKRRLRESSRADEWWKSKMVSFKIAPEELTSWDAGAIAVATGLPNPRATLRSFRTGVFGRFESGAGQIEMIPEELPHGGRNAASAPSAPASAQQNGDDVTPTVAPPPAPRGIFGRR